MLLDAHNEHKKAFRKSDWLVRLNLVYLALMPALLVGALVYLAWIYLTI